MLKKIKAVIKIQAPAAKATPAPPVGPALAQEGFTIPVEITVYEDRTYDFKLKSPPASELLKKAAGIEKGSGEPNKTKVGKITREQLRKVALQKMADLNTDDIKKAIKIIKATAENMGIEISD